jgi:exodeoxyribonuclease VII small subunit
MRSDSLLLTIILLLVWESAIPAQGRLTPQSNGASALAASAAHLKLKPAEWRSLNEKQIITRPVAGGHSKEMAGFGAMIADASPEEFVKVFSALSMFKNSETTLACGRFSAQPVIEDLAKLEIGDKDLYALMRARVKESDIKLSEADIARIHAVAGSSPYFSSALKTKLAAEYKRMLLDKARAYVESGETALDEAIALWERGEKLYRFCLGKLDTAQGKIEELATRVEATKS